MTAINVRGEPWTGSYLLSEAAATKLGVGHIDLPLESRGAPQRDRIRQLLKVYQTMPGAGLLYCKAGADRAGLAAGLCVLFEGGSVSDALRQLSLRHGHVKQGPTGILDCFFLRYQRDGERQGKPFLDWLDQDYDELALRDDYRTKGIASFIND